MGGFVGQSFDLELLERGELVLFVRLAHREHQRDVLGQEPAPYERQRLHGRLVEPLRVVDQTEQWLVLRGVGDEAQHRQPDQEAIRWLARTEPEGSCERGCLG